MPTVRVNKQSIETLNTLSELSGQNKSYIVNQWLTELKKILVKRGAMQGISLMSICSKKHDNVITLISPIIILSDTFPDSVSDEQAEKQLKEGLD